MFGAASFAQPTGLGIAPDGTMIVSDDTGAVWRVAANGATAQIAKFDTFISNPVMDSQGNVYVGADVTIQKITPDGKASTLAGKTGASGLADGVGSAARFAWVSGLAMDANGTILAADNGNGYVRRIAMDGTVTTLNKKPIEQPVQPAVDKSGNVYVTSCPATGGYLYRINSDGSLVSIAGNGTTGPSEDTLAVRSSLPGPIGAVFDDAGVLWISGL